MKRRIIGISITLVTLLLIGTAADARHSHGGSRYSFSFGFSSGGYYYGPPVVRVYPYYRNDVWIVYRDYDRYYYGDHYYRKFKPYKKYYRPGRWYKYDRPGYGYGPWGYGKKHYYRYPKYRGHWYR